MPVVIPGDDPIIIEPEPGGGGNPDPTFNPAFNLIELDRLRRNSQFENIDGSNLTVVVIDSGFDAIHPALNNNFTQTDNSNPPLLTNADDTYDVATDGHGTHIAGTIGATQPILTLVSPLQLG